MIVHEDLYKGYAITIAENIDPEDSTDLYWYELNNGELSEPTLGFLTINDALSSAWEHVDTLIKKK